MDIENAVNRALDLDEIKETLVVFGENSLIPSVVGVLILQERLKAEMTTLTIDTTGNGNSLSSNNRLVFTSRRVTGGSGSTRLKAVEVAVSQCCGKDCAIYYDLTRKTTIVSCSGLSTDVIKVTMALAPIVLPWIFKRMPLENHEGDILRSLMSGDTSPLMAEFEKWAKAHHFDEVDYGKFLFGFKTGGLQEALVKAEQAYWNNQREIEELLKTIARMQQEAEICRLNYENLQRKVENGDDSELVSFLKSCASVKLYRRESKTIYFQVFDYLDNIDEAMYENLIEKRTGPSIFWDKMSSYTVAQMKRFYKSVWDERTFKIRVWAALRIESDARVSPVHNRCDYTGTDYFPNPHIVSHSCVGSFANQMGQAITAGDHILAFNAAIGLTKNLNLADGIIVRKFMEDLKTYDKRNYRFIEDRNGSLYSFREVIAILDQEGENEE